MNPANSSAELQLLDLLPADDRADASRHERHFPTPTACDVARLRRALELSERLCTGNEHTGDGDRREWSVVEAAASAEHESQTPACFWPAADPSPGFVARWRAPWSGAAIELFAGLVVRALDALAAGGDGVPMSDLLGVEQRSRVLDSFNSAPHRSAGPDTVCGRFAIACALDPDAPAVLDASGGLSYRALDRHSDVLAAQLGAQGVRAGEIVGLLAPRSRSAVAGMLAILKAGGAYLPLDAEYPAERLAYMLADSDVRLVLYSDPADLALLPSTVTALPLDVSSSDASAPACTVEGESLAYVMYTSGSTGLPKGVEIPQRAIVRLVCGANYLPLDRSTRLLHAAPLGFDASTLEIWGALLNGGCLLVHDEPVPSGPGLAAAISRHQINTAWLTAALFNAVVDDDPRHLAGLRDLITGGEALSVAHVRRMLERAPHVRLHNGYGPTECTTFTCTQHIESVPADAHSIPIGRPITDTRVYVFNAAREPVPMGVIGELYVGGDGVALGYRGQPELTAERFVDDPFTAGGRLYRTGDLVRWREAGVLEFIGRADGQVKIHGHRIELSEIESVLAEHPGVRACAVLARADRGSDKRLVAYVVSALDPAPSVSALRSHLAARLPEFMLPTHTLFVERLPMTANGKLDWRALPAPGRDRPELAGPCVPPRDDLERAICAAMADLLDIEPVGRDDHFFDLGGGSLLALRLLQRVRVLVDPARQANLSVTVIFANPTPTGLAARLRAHGHDSGLEHRISRHVARGGQGGIDEPIAIIAMAGRFPGAADVETFWENLLAGRDGVTHFSVDQLDPGLDPRDTSDPGYVRARGVIDGVELFDAAFFGIPPRQAELMDPQHRLLLELSWECLERAGHAPDSTEVPVGVFAGMNNATYFQRHVSRHPELIEKVGAFQVMLDNEKDFLTTRVAHKLNLTGPAISIHTACSTSLVAICQAVDGLRRGQCDMALAGGVSITCPPRSGYRYQEGAMLSPDGVTRSFDAQAGGTVFSDGAAVVLLKRLSDARADGNPVIALIRGCAVNNDGGHKASFTAPSADGQAAVIAMALADAGVDARSIGYVETHGTATPVGDPIELEGLRKAFAGPGDEAGWCRIGSVKSNVGHLVIAAGATGAIKTALALQQRKLPASIHYRSANPDLELEHSPFRVQAECEDWSTDAEPRRAGVSSFGVGGTNAHVILEQAPAAPGAEGIQGPHLLTLSARTPSALAASAERLAVHLQAHPRLDLGDVAWTLARGRSRFAHRLAIVADDAESAAGALRAQAIAAARGRPAHARDVVFMFPGQGAHYPGMGRVLYEHEPAFRQALEECFAALEGRLDFDLRAAMFTDDAQALLPTARMQPAIFAFEYALARWWMTQGVRPAAMLGHSVGEFVAATIAGVFELPDALALVARRGALMQAQPAGAMLSVRMAADAVLSRLPASLCLAADNAPGACVVAGAQAEIDVLRVELGKDGIACRPLVTSHAFHSAMMEPVLEPFARAVEAVARRVPGIRVMSTALGDWLDQDHATSVDYWTRHLRQPVRFGPALARLLAEPGKVFLEVGPRASLVSLGRQQPTAAQSTFVATLADAADKERESLRLAVGQLWAHGAGIDPALFDRRTRRNRLCLPTYPFERQRYWVEAVAAPRADVVPHPLMSAGQMSTGMTSAIRPEPPMSTPAPEANPSVNPAGRKPYLIAQLRELFEDVAGFDMGDADAQTHFMEIGLDSLMLTQIALQLQKVFGVSVGFRQLMGEAASLGSLAELIDAQLPPEAAPAAAAPPLAGPIVPVAATAPTPGVNMASLADGGQLQQLIAQQMLLMQQQLALLSGGAVAPAAGAAPVPAAASAPLPKAAVAAPAQAGEDEAVAHTRYDVKKAFGAIARIDTGARFNLDAAQQRWLDAFVARYTQRTAKSKQYTQAHRRHMADPRVVNGFRPLLKEIIYQIVIGRSKGAHLWDLDGNQYVDALNGFGMSLFGWQPDFVLDAVRKQLDLGYEIGPQHPLAGEVAERICALTGHDRAALCNTGSEAVLGALRIARTVTGREDVVVFNGAYHGIIDEMIVRGTRKLRAVPAAPGILRNTAEHVWVLEYGTPESLQFIREHAHELAAVLIEPVQSRRPDFQPVEFLREVRQITRDAGALCVFDEVVTGFRAHPAGAQGYFGITADLATYGKVVGGGYPIGVIAGRRDYMDALDGGWWQFGDDSVPTVGVTYFAGTFVRHPLALAAADAVLKHLQMQGPQLQATLNARVAAFADELNTFCREVGAPILLKQFASVWKTQFLEDHPLQDLLFALMRSRGIHILDNFPCFFTTAHAEADFQAIAAAFRESVLELQSVGLLPRAAITPRTAMDAEHPPVEGARIGRDPEGHPGWYISDTARPGKYQKVGP